MCALLGVEVIEVGRVLEVVCQNGAVFNDVVGNDVIVVGLDVEGDVLLCEDLLCDLKDLCVRSGGCCNGDGGACESCVVNAAVEAVGEVIYGGNYAAVVLLVDEVCYLLAFESCLECLDCVGVFVAFLDCEDVAVCRGGAFLEQGVLNGVEACVYCIVAVDDCVVNVGKELGDRRGSASTISTLYGFSAMSFLVAVMPAPSLSLMMPASWSRSSARASLVVSLGTAILMTLSEALSPPLPEPEHAARLNASTTASASAIILVNFFIFVFSLKVLNLTGRVVCQ